MARISIKKVYDSCEEAVAVWKRWDEIPSSLQPDHLAYHDGAATIEYAYVPGVPPTSFMHVLWQAMNRFLWQPGNLSGPKPTIQREAYVEYIRSRVLKLPYDCQVSDAVMQYVYDKIRTSQLTPVQHCHGDLTVSNIIKRPNGTYTLIDPGFTRGLHCRELDESKLLQSLMGWDQARWGLPAIEGPLPFVPRTIHKVLLLTHYIRLLCHEHPMVAIGHAQGCMERIVKDFEDAIKT